MREAGAPSTEYVAIVLWERSVPATPEVDMLAPQMLLCNASMAQT
jgi:hypothetical protein